MFKVGITDASPSASHGIGGDFAVRFCIHYFFSDLIAPLLVAIVLAYLLEWPVRLLNEKLKCPRLVATMLVLGSFIQLGFVVVLVLIRIYGHS